MHLIKLNKHGCCSPLKQLMRGIFWACHFSNVWPITPNRGDVVKNKRSTFSDSWHFSTWIILTSWTVLSNSVYSTKSQQTALNRNVEMSISKVTRLGLFRWLVTRLEKSVEILFFPIFWRGFLVVIWRMTMDKVLIRHILTKPSSCDSFNQCTKAACISTLSWMWRVTYFRLKFAVVSCTFQIRLHFTCLRSFAGLIPPH